MPRRGEEAAPESAPGGARRRYRVIAEVVGSESLPGDHHRLALRAPEIAACAEPGQFLQVWCHPPDEIARPPSAAMLRRPLSISRLRPPDDLELLLRVRGVGGAILARKVAGDRLDIIGPLGHGFAIAPDLQLAVIVAGGIGIAPAPFLVERLAARRIRTILLVGAKEDSRLPFLIARSARGAASMPALEVMGAEVRYVSEAIEGQLVSQLLEERLEEFVAPGTEFFAVGPRAMMRRVAQITRDRAPVQVSLEERMACGVGACRSCVVPVIGQEGPELVTVCREGPVFQASEIDWERLRDANP
jgi:dihydroorotate dehydrogenase electron transfer subunit